MAAASEERRMDARTKLLLALNVLVAMSSGGALGATALLSLNPGVGELLPAPAAAAAPLLLPALAAVALALALLLVAAKHTPTVLYTYAALSLSLVAAAAGAGGWLVLLTTRAVLDHKWRVAATGFRVVASAVTGGLVGAGQAATYATYSLNLAVGAAWAALTGAAQLAAAVLAVLAARRAMRRASAAHAI